jgi:hypothetical protein
MVRRGNRLQLRRAILTVTTRHGVTVSAKEVLLEYIKAPDAKDVGAMLALFHEACVFENISGGKAS